MRDLFVLAPLTTLRIGGPARDIVEVTSADDLVDTVRDLDEAGEPVLLLGGGSNVVVSDEGFDGTVVLIRTQGLVADVDSCSGATLTVAAGEVWDDFVAHAVAEEWVGVETLSGIPGLVGGTPIQNVGAYGQEVSQTISRVRTYDRLDRRVVTYSADDCGFGYRTSRFKQEPGRHVVLEVTFQLRLGSLSAPVQYAELARALGVEVGARVPLGAVREAVLELRAGKGMVLDPDDHDTWSAGSFFTNPVLSAEAAAGLPTDAPRFTQPDGRVKTSAAWLIERAGFSKGYGDTAARVSSKHTLALTNRGGATGYELLALAREIRDGVEAKFDVRLENEPVLVGATL
ncbi:UDP-N-acetylmuramate dehydrogenase [Mumia zhuanghuii]|uniref:UDP-N-acetylenolpyruvoylglucosamine reductase n=2 Tax=Mumia TaxID=1546255 RepID=A0ABW1QM13_9ACTN|nr:MULTISPECIES: UDP-N-acetylmuramate dehydrogenase [Mumia]KAA1422226.1 UDP-N-acetylmuramate dehydrogenase [Mumia zhuanghuii]